MADEHNFELIGLTAGITAAYVENNAVLPSDLSTLIQNIHRALKTVEGPMIVAEAPKAPAVPINKSLGDDFLICLEDGRKFKSLKRHLRTKYDMSPEEYRAKWGLPKTYPMVAPAYAAARSALAKQMGLGQGRRASAAAKPAARTRVKKI